MCRAAQPHERKGRDLRPGGLDRQAGPGREFGGAQALDHGAGGGAAVGVEQVGGGVDLGVEVVGGAVAAEAAAAVEDRCVGEEEAGGVVVAWDGEGGHLGEGLGGGVEEFGDELWGLVGEADGEVLAAGDEDLAVGEDDAVVEGTREGHGRKGGYGWGDVGVGEGYDVCVGGGVGV